MLTWSNQNTTGEHFAILCDYKLRINQLKLDFLSNILALKFFATSYLHPLGPLP